MDSEEAQYEVVKGNGPDTAFVELWDRSLAPGGLAFEVVANDRHVVTVTGYEVPIPFTVVEGFLREARSYLTPELDPKT